MNQIDCFFNFKRHGWKFDNEKLLAVKEGLGIRNYIIFSRHRILGSKNVWGVHVLKEHKKFGRFHHIQIKTNMPSSYLNKCILHEMMHAVQAERYDNCDAWTLAYHNAGGNYFMNMENPERYRNNEFELEAEQFANTYADIISVIKT